LGANSQTTLSSAAAQALDTTFTINGSQTTETFDATGGELSVGSAGNERIVTNVADGRVAADSSDVVNGSQFYGAVQAINDNTSNITTNTSNITTNTSNIATNTSNITTNTSNIAANTDNIAVNTANISTNSSNIAVNAGNIASNANSIGVNANNITVNANSIGVNANSIQENRVIIDDNTNRINTVENDLDLFRGEASAGIAGAAAFITPVPTDSGSTLALGGASFNGEQAVSLNYGYTFPSNPNINLVSGVALTSEGSNVYRFGVQYRFGTKKKNSNFTLDNSRSDTVRLNREIAELKRENSKIRQENTKMQKSNAEINKKLDTVMQYITVLQEQGELPKQLASRP